MRSSAILAIWSCAILLTTGCSRQEQRPLVSGPAAKLSDVESAPYWPAFQGPRGDNISDATGLLREWPADGPPQLWTAQGIGHGYSSVSLARGLIFTAGNINEQSVVTALDLDGRIVWQTPAGGAWTDAHAGTRSTPTVDVERIYFQSPMGDLYCLDAATGQEIWSTNVLDRFGAENIEWGLAESNLVDGDRVLSTPGGPRTAVVALDKMTGETVWQSPSASGDPAGYSTPTLVEYLGKRLIFAFMGKSLICLDADDGNLHWRFAHETSYDVNALNPIFHEGKVFISSGYGSGSRLLQVEVNGDEVAVEEPWTNADLDNHHGGVVLLDGCLYGADHRREWIGVDWGTGRTLCRERGVGKGSLTCAEGMLYTLSERGEMGLVAAAGKQFEVVSRFRLDSQGAGPTWAYPVVCDGRLYLRHDEFLFCYDVRAE